MLVSGGKVLAIDKVLTDKKTLTGDGCFVPLGVSGMLTIADAEKTYQPKGNYVDQKALKNYYTKLETDTTFAKIANVYNKSEVDGKLTLYETKADHDSDVNDLKQADINTNKKFNDYYTKSQADGLFITQNILNTTITTAINEYDDTIVQPTFNDLRNIIDDNAAACAAHAADGNIHLNADGTDRAFIDLWKEYNPSAFFKESDLNGKEVNKQYVLRYNGPDSYYKYSWEPLSYVPGPGGGDNISAKNGITADLIGDTKWIQLAQPEQDLLKIVSDKNADWTNAADLIGDTTEIAGGPFIDVSMQNEKLVISYTGNTVMFTENKSTATAANTVYLVLEDVG